jgi:hypothetical protein
MKTKLTKPGIIAKGAGRKKNPNDDMAIEPGDLPSAPPPPPPGTAQPKGSRKTRITKPV